MNRNARAGVARRGLTAAALAACVATPALAAEGQLMAPVVSDLSELSLEELANVQITSVSKRPETLSQAAAAVYVITDEDIRRSAALNLPEALRLAPNLQVARVDAQRYAISARGFNGYETSNKLLVMIDGRSIYAPFHAGVLWDAQQVMLDDLARIEVVRGPGGTLWGANAVNGVVNVISKSAADTQGLLFHAAGGELNRRADIRYGGALGEAGAYRVYATGFDQRDTLLPGGTEAGDGWQGGQMGFRSDFALGEAGAFTLQGDAYYDRIDAGGRVNGGNLLGRWTREFAGGSTLEAQAYYDRAARYSPPIGPVFPWVEETVETLDAQVQHTLPAGRRQQVVWGGGYRVIDDAFLIGPVIIGGVPFPWLKVDPEKRRLTLANLFVQDEVRLSEDLTLTLGLKLEDSSYSGLEYMPNVRLAWRPSDDTMLWAAISRAVRTPSRVERDLIFPNVIEGGFFESESVIAYEAGYRGMLSDKAVLSVSAFFNDYSDLRTNEYRANGTGPVHVGNGMEGQNWGVEAWGGYQLMDDWRVSLGVSTLGKDFHEKPGHDDIAFPVSTGNDPEYQVMLRSQANLWRRLELDLIARAVDELSGPPTVPAYVELEARLGWRVTEEAELYLAGANLLDDQRREDGDPDYVNEVRRSLYAGLRVRF